MINGEGAWKSLLMRYTLSSPLQMCSECGAGIATIIRNGVETDLSLLCIKVIFRSVGKQNVYATGAKRLREHTRRTQEENNAMRWYLNDNHPYNDIQ